MNTIAKTKKAYEAQCEIDAAARDGDFDAMLAAIEKGANVKGFGDKSITPLMWAAQNGNVDIMMWLCDQGVDIEATSWAGYRALTDAVVHGHSDAVIMLLNRKANRNIMTDCGKSLFELTANPDILAILNMPDY